MTALKRRMGVTEFGLVPSDLAQELDVKPTFRSFLCAAPSKPAITWAETPNSCAIS